ncbi:MAG: hypothetical protein JO097_00535 [Acidobacteriaceae bacterium]|nr:hypothetical protein [Acidobacteriaceae bacterium]
MKIQTVAQVLGILAASELGAGCSDELQPSSLGPTSVTNAARNGASPLATGGINAFAGVGPQRPAHPNHHKPWISPDAKHEHLLLFASDSGLDEVDIYSLPSFKLRGQLTGFNNPQGMCSDAAGNVYVTQTNNTEIDKYSHAGKLLARIPDNYGFPVGCAVDPATGNLAVTDLVNDGSGPGEVEVFSSPSSQPRILTNPNQYFYYFAGYGPDSRLLVSGMNASGIYMLSRCGASSCSTINLRGGTLYYPGAVQWESTQGGWVVFDQMCDDKPAACSYRVSAKGVLGAASTYSNYEGGNDCDLIQGEIATDHHQYVVGGDYEYCGAAPSTLNRWSYSAGGKPTNYTVLSSKYSVPNGVAISAH